METPLGPNGTVSLGLEFMLVTQLVYNPLTSHTTPQFHVVFDDYFQTVAPHLSSASHTEIDALFDSLWKDSQWNYNGDIPPEYLFPKNIDFLTSKDTDNVLHAQPPDDQLPPDPLEDILINPLCPREPLARHHYYL